MKISGAMKICTFDAKDFIQKYSERLSANKSQFETGAKHFEKVSVSKKIVSSAELKTSLESNSKLIKNASKEKYAIPTTPELHSKLINPYSDLSLHQCHNTSQAVSAKYDIQVSHRKPNCQKMSEYRSVTNHSIQQTPHQSPITHSDPVLVQFERNAINRTQNMRSNNIKWEPRSTTEYSIPQASHRSHNDLQSTSIRYKSRVFFRKPNRDYIHTENKECQPRSVTNSSTLQTSHNFHRISQAVLADNESQGTNRKTNWQTIPSKNIRWVPRSDTDGSTLQKSHNSHNTSQAHNENQSPTRKSNWRNIPSKNIRCKTKTAADSLTLQTSHQFQSTMSDNYERQVNTREPTSQNLRRKNNKWKSNSVSDSFSLQTSLQFHNTSQAASAQYQIQKRNKQNVRSNNIKWIPRSVTDLSIPQASRQSRNNIHTVSAQYVSKANTEKLNMQPSNNIKEQQPEKVSGTLIQQFPHIVAPVPKAVYKSIVTVIESKEASSSNLEDPKLVTGPSVIQNIRPSSKTLKVELKDLQASQNIESFSYISNSVPADYIPQSSKSEKNGSAENFKLSELQGPQTLPYINEPVPKAIIRSVTLIEENRIITCNLGKQRSNSKPSNRQNISYSPNVQKILSSKHSELSTTQKKIEQSSSALNHKDDLISTKANKASHINLDQQILFPVLSSIQDNPHSTNHDKSGFVENNVFTLFKKCPDLPCVTHPVSSSNVEENVTYREESTISESYIEKQTSNNSSIHDVSNTGETKSTEETGFSTLQSFRHNFYIGESLHSLQNLSREANRQSDSNLEEHRLVDRSLNIPGTHNTEISDLRHNYDYLTPQEFLYYHGTPPPSVCYTNNVTFSKENTPIEEHTLDSRLLDAQNVYDISNTTEIGCVEHQHLHNIQYTPYISHVVPIEYHQQHMTATESSRELYSTLEDRLASGFSSIQETNYSPNGENMVSIENGLPLLQCVPLSGPYRNDNFSEANRVLASNSDSFNTGQNVQESSTHQNYQQHLPAIAQPVYASYGNNASDREHFSQRSVAGSLDVQDSNSTHQNYHQHLPAIAQPVYVPFVNRALGIEDYIRRLMVGSTDNQCNISTHKN